MDELSEFIDHFQTKFPRLTRKEIIERLKYQFLIQKSIFRIGLVQASELADRLLPNYTDQDFLEDFEKLSELEISKRAKRWRI